MLVYRGRRRVWFPWPPHMDDLEIPTRETELVPAAVAPVEGLFAPSPYNYRFDGEDHLRITSWNSQASVRIAVHGRLQNLDGTITPFRHEHVPNTDRSAKRETFVMGRGYLLNVCMFAVAGSPQRGQTFARLHVVRGAGPAFTVLGTLLQDYLTAGQDIGWPGSPIRSSDEGYGFPRLIEGTAPAANVEIEEFVPTGALWEVHTIQIELTCVATVADRRPILGFYANPTMLWQVGSRNIAVAGEQRKFVWARGSPEKEMIYAGGQTVEHLPLGVALRPAMSIKTVTQGFQVGDQYGSMDFFVTERLEAAS